MNWKTLVALDQRLSALELAASLTAPPSDSADFWRVWVRITRQLDEIVDGRRWQWQQRDVCYDHLLHTFENAAERRGSVEAQP